MTDVVTSSSSFYTHRFTTTDEIREPLFYFIFFLSFSFLLLVPPHPLHRVSLMIITHQTYTPPSPINISFFLLPPLLLLLFLLFVCRYRPTNKGCISFSKTFKHFFCPFFCCVEKASVISFFLYVYNIINI